MPTFKVNIIPSSNDIILLVTFFIINSHNYITKMNTFIRFEEYYEEDQQVLNKPLSSRIHIIDIKFPKLPLKEFGSVKPSLGGKLDSSYGPYRKVCIALTPCIIYFRSFLIIFFSQFKRGRTAISHVMSKLGWDVFKLILPLSLWKMRLRSCQT